MKSILMLGAAAVVAAVMASNGRISGDTANAAVTPAGEEAYLLQFAGLDASCTIRRASRSDMGDVKLVVGDGCSDMLAGATLWRDNVDGSVSFVSASGQTILEFAQSDGAAYETFRAGSPLASLIAAD